MAISFIKKGAESVAAAEKAAVEAQIRKEAGGKMWRFWMNKGEDNVQITFVDGDLDKEGHFIPDRLFQHQLFLNGSWNNFFVCPEKTDPSSGDKCPICEGGDNPSLVALLTVIDHRTQYSADKTKKYVDQRRLFVAKSDTFEMLAKIAVKRGGLAGCRFDVMRVGDKSANVGSNFDFVDKTPVEELKLKYTEERTDPKTNVKTTVTKFIPANYEEEFVYRTGDELRKMGLGNPNSGSGGASSPAGSEVPATDYTNQL